MARTGLTYPQTRIVEQVDDYFGVSVADPYRWLEDDNDPEVKAWGDTQNALTFGYLEQISFRQQIKKRLEQLWNYEKYSTPFQRGPRYFFFKNDGLQDQAVLYVQEPLEAEPDVLLDPNTLSEDGTVALTNLGFSKDGRYMAYGISRSGSDWQELYVIDVFTRQHLDDKIEWAKFTNISWHGYGFYYSRYDQPKDGVEYSQANEYHKVYYHRLGVSQQDDRLIYENPEAPYRNMSASVTEDERYLVLEQSEGTSGNSLAVMDLQQPEQGFVPIIEDFEHDHIMIDSLEERLLILTNLDAPNWRLVAVEASCPTPNRWQDVLAESDDVLMDVTLAGEHLIAHSMRDAQSKLCQYSLHGEYQCDIPLPGIGSLAGLHGKRGENILFYGFTSFTLPITVYRYELDTGTTALLFQSQVNFEPDDFETRQVFYVSKDGTQVPMFITCKKEMTLDGTNPAYLYAYGGFNNPQPPTFKIEMLYFLEQGGVYAVANLRGGGEYGEHWHKSGMLKNKQRVFDDFIAAAEYLIREGYTCSERLAVAGRSNGGLLIGAVMTQCPDLFRVALPAVGVMDMLRYQHFTIGWAWAVEYGRADHSKEEFDYLYAYSPLHNLKPGTGYPATLVTTADHDDRVVPAHSFKFIATLQQAQAADQPVLIRIDKKAGHGAGKPTAMQIEEIADIWAFVLYNLDVRPES